MNQPAELEFYGAAGEVTGSCHILRAGGHQILLDCGMIQGGRKRQERNREPFPFDAEQVDAVVLSHAHVDHCGRLPLLVQRGFTGLIYAQRATRDICRIMLEDSARLAEYDVKTENRKRARKALPPVQPLFTPEDVERTLALFVPLDYGERHTLLPGISIRFQDAGHILGSSIVEAWFPDDGVERKLVFSGDLGQYDTPILRDPVSIEAADLVLLESTYGDRLHRDRAATLKEIAEIIASADHHRGNILIPAFAVGRSQELLYLLGLHYEEWGLVRWKIFLDSPMAIRATEVYQSHTDLYDRQATRVTRELNGRRLLPNLTFSETADQSRRVNKIQHGAIIIAGSGMCEGGRIVHHLKHNVWRPECHVLIIGYQAEGTLGRRLVDGDTYVRVQHETMRVRAQVHTVGGLSAHGDQDDLVRWYKGFQPAPPVCLVHGESKATEGFGQRLREEGAPSVCIAAPGQRLNPGRPATGRRASA